MQSTYPEGNVASSDIRQVQIANVLVRKTLFLHIISFTDWKKSTNVIRGRDRL